MRGNFLRGACLCLVTLLLCLSGCAGERITRAVDGQRVEFHQMIASLKDARVVFIGESHDNKRHHQFQLQVIKALHDSGKPVAIGVEMFAAASQERLDQWNEGRMDSLTFEWLYADHWSEPWSLYRDIFLYARQSRIPVVALNLDKKLVHQVSTQGVASLAEKELEQLPRITCAANSPYTLFLGSAYHSHSPVGSFENFCLAQTLWNRYMALKLGEYLRRHPEQTVVAVVGTFHALKEAVPAALSPIESRVLVPEPSEVGVEGLGARDADFFYR